MIFDTTALAAEHRRLVDAALARCTYPFAEHGPGVTIPVEFADLARYLQRNTARVRGHDDDHAHISHPGAFPELADHGHVHVDKDDTGERGHGIVFRQQALGLYWLPTARYPGGRVSIEQALDPELAQEVFLCEAAHAVDYVAMTDAQRRAVNALYHGGQHPPVPGHERCGWFDERGERRYAWWPGEAWMVTFVRAFSDLTVRFDQFAHPSTPQVVAAARQILVPPPPVVGFSRRHVYHRPACPVVRSSPGRTQLLTAEQAAARRACRLCKPTLTQ